MKIIKYFNLIVLTLIPSIINLAHYRKTIYESGPTLINSVVCVGVSYLFPSESKLENDEKLVVSLKELNEDGLVTGWTTEIDRIPLNQGFDNIWINHSKTVHFDHVELFILSVVHEGSSMEGQATQISISVSLDKNECLNESTIDYVNKPTSQPFVTSTIEKINVDVTTVITSNPTELDINVTATNDDPVTKVSTNVDLITEITSTLNNQSPQSTEPTQSTQSTQSKEPTQSTQSTEPTEPTQSTQSTQSPQSTQSTQSTQSPQSTQSTLTPTQSTESFTFNPVPVAIIDTENNKAYDHDLKTVDSSGNLIVSLKFFTNKRYTIALTCGLIGLIVTTIGLTVLISQRKQQDYQVRNQELIVSATRNGIELNTSIIKTIKQ